MIDRAIVTMSYVFGLGMAHPLVALLLSELEDDLLKEASIDAYRKFCIDRKDNFLETSHTELLASYDKEIDRIVALSHPRVPTVFERQLLALTFSLIRANGVSPNGAEQMDEVWADPAKLDEDVTALIQTHVDGVMEGRSGTQETNKLIQDLQDWAIEAHTNKENTN